MKIKMLTVIAKMLIMHFDHTQVMRASANHYAMIGVGTVETINCTITAQGPDHLSAQVSEDDHWIYFYDQNDEMEGSCQIGHTPVIFVAADPPIVRGIALIPSN